MRNVWTFKKGTNLLSLFNSRVINKVKMKQDRLMIGTTPNRLNSAPVVFYEDITAVDITKRVNFYYIFWIALCVVLAFWTSGATLILAALFLYAGLDNKVKISQRNGKDIIMYSRNKSIAESLKEDIQKVADI